MGHIKRVLGGEAPETQPSRCMSRGSTGITVALKGLWKGMLDVNSAKRQTALNSLNVSLTFANGCGDLCKWSKWSDPHGLPRCPSNTLTVLGVNQSINLWLTAHIEICHEKLIMESQYSWLVGDLLHALVCWNGGSDMLGELGKQWQPRQDSE